MQLRKFNPNMLVPKVGIITGELFRSKQLNSALALHWKIDVFLEDFILGDYPIFDSIIIVASFTLPYISSEENYDSNFQLLRSWKQLSFTKFKFENSKVDNIGVIYYSILDKFVKKVLGN